MGWINLLFRFFMLGPIGLGVIAAGFFVGGYFLQVQQNEVRANERAALAGGRPQAVDIQAFNPETDSNQVREAHLRAQMLTDSTYELTIEERIGDKRAIMVPLLATDSTTPEVIGVALWTGPGFDFDYANNGRMFAKTERVGPYGYVARLNGRISSLGTWDEIVKDAFADEGLTLPADAVVIYPYIGGRQVALDAGAAGGSTIFGVFSKIGGAIGLFALLKLVFRSGSGRKEEEAAAPATDPVAAAMAAPALDPITTPSFDSTPEPGVPLWKQRLQQREAQEAAFDPLASVANYAAADTHDDAAVTYEEEWADAVPQETAEEDDWGTPSYGIAPSGDDTADAIRRFAFAEPEPEPVAQEVEEDFDVMPAPSYNIVGGPEAEPPAYYDDDPVIETPRRRGFGLRKLATLLVGGAFALVLVAVLGSLVSEAFVPETPAVQAHDPVRVMAERLADEFIPANADPDRPFYQVDVSGVARWFLVKGIMALNGDKGSIILLMSIIGGVLLSGFLLRFYFIARASFSPKVSPNIAGMGLN